MKYSIIIMLAMVVATLSFTACGGSESDDEFDGGGSSSAIVGTWKAEDIGGWVDREMNYVSNGGYVQFKKDGTFIVANVKYDKHYGDWTLSNNTLNLHYTDDAWVGVRLSYDVITLNQQSLTIAIYGLKINYKRVSDSEINKYLK